MMRYFVLTVFALLFVSVYSFAQEQEKKRDYVNTRGYSEGSEYSVFSGTKKAKKNKKFLGIFGKKESSPYSFEEKIEEYEELMEANAKKYKKMAKEMEKPQYSDPTYFGHKKKPKKRKPGKKKFCKECGLVH